MRFGQTFVPPSSHHSEKGERKRTTLLLDLAMALQYKGNGKKMRRRSA